MASFQARLTFATLILWVALVSGLSFHHQALAGDNNLSWAQLSDDQRKVLNPLASEWDTLRPWQREKMLDIARDYPKMAPGDRKSVV